MSDREIVITRRPVKDKGALMQTLHLRFRDLRAILLGGTPSQWPTPSLRTASIWETASPLPSLGSARSAAKLSPGEFPRSCFTPLRPTLAVGAHPKISHRRLDRSPTLGAGLTMASPLREPRVGGATARDTSRVCWSQTAENTPHPLREPNRPSDDLQEARLPHHEAGQVVGCSLQARFSEVQWTPSNGLSFPLRTQRCQRAPRSGARAFGEKTTDQPANDVALAGVSSGACQRRLRFRRGVH